MSKQAEREYALRVKQTSLYKRPYHKPRVMREFATVVELFQEHVRKGSILDLGCGPGWTSLFLARAGFDVVGVDISERMIEVAQDRSRREHTRAQFIVADMEELDLEERDFDGVLLFDALHHCPAWVEVLRSAYAHLRPGGCLLLMEPTWLHNYSPHARATTKKFGVTELGFTRRQLRRALRQAGFRRISQYHDLGGVHRGVMGFLAANLRLWAGHFFCYPRVKHVMLAIK